ncbi:hypothetical protein [Undibacterium umbellatum]|uniref:DUF1570 domain-containing protein n=1 Tax=Undibacterium umbellatum TaxID=2762300 RepID=A0ABR6ZIA6_9BURK|nr:hypothetical protein [Undibacterium umbellatum]MBC3911430.1 hypothetical protein [Undibacterium umbellatum]
MIFLFILLALLALNIYSTHRIKRALEPSFQRTMLLISVWAMPFIGSFFALPGLPKNAHESRALPPEKLPAGFIREEIPDLISLPGVTPFNLFEHITFLDNIPVMNWAAFHAWLGTINDAGLQRHARLLGQRAWLAYIKEGIGSHCYMYESEKALIVSSSEPNVIEASARFIEKNHARIAKLLPGVAQFPSDMKSILLVLDNEDMYYQYVSAYYPESGEFAASGGMFIDAGCPHFVTVLSDLLMIEPVITHEMTHSALNYLKLPLWLDEGIAVNVEFQLSPFLQEASSAKNLYARHLQFWNPERIQEFWSGASFSRSGESNTLSYDLARILVKNLSQDWQAFARFVAAAKREDSGSRAALEILNIDLGASVCALFDTQWESSWSPHIRMGSQAVAA